MEATMHPEHLPACQVVLVGRRCDDNLNLGLDYLLAALEQAGIAARALTLNHWGQLEPTCASILAHRPLLVGLSLADGGSAFLPLGLGELLQQRGFAGHITCGGQFATLARRWLLARYAWLDSVVRFAGEVPLVSLLRCLERRGDPRQVPGLTTLAGDGLPADPLDATPLRLVPRRAELPQLLGHAVAHITATRGCAGRCAYCSPAALLAQEREEARGRGCDTATLNAAGVGGVKRRPLDAVCDEMATLHERRGVRYFYFVDEHLLPYDEPEALAYLRQWRAGLRRRRVRPLGIGTMLRANRISTRVARAFADTGLVRAFIGIEFGSAQEGRRYGRRTDLARVPELLRTLRRREVATISNLMLVHPDSTLETIRAGLTLVDNLPAGLCEINQMMVYHGTRLQQRLARQGRLVGNPLRYHYTFTDPAVERFTELFWRLRAEAFRNYSVVLRSHDAALALALASRLAARRGPALTELWRALDQICSRVTGLYVRSLGRALQLAAAGPARADAGDAAGDALVAETSGQIGGLVQELEALHDAITAELGRPARVFSPMRAAAATAIGFVIVGGLSVSAGCGHRTRGADGALAVVDTSPQVDLRPSSDGAACTAARGQQQQQALVNRVLTDVPCFWGTLNVDPQQGQVTASASKLSQLSFCKDPASELLLKGREAAAEKAVAGMAIECVKDRYASVKGGRYNDQEQMEKVLTASCGNNQPFGLNAIYGVQIVLDASGKVQDVVSRPGATPDPAALLCVKQALAGLTFPCLAGFQICPEHIIVE